ncbi:MAG: hypothetical protein MR966_02140 [Lachnospiraceae bacterium]|nr:hypothetical protein [Lachnospiraceae bacterium]
MIQTDFDRVCAEAEDSAGKGAVMETLMNRMKMMIQQQEVRITAALQLIFCFMAITLAVRNEFHTSQKKRRKAARRKK